MPAWLGPAIAGAASLVGTAWSNASNAAQARRQMEFQERMSSTAHQRQYKDLEAAGVNPMLAAGGAGASTPVGAQARMDSAIGRGVSSAMSARMNEKQLELLEAQIQKEVSAAQLNHAHNFNITSTTPGTVREINARTALHEIDTNTRKQLVGLVAQHMSAETAAHLASALNARSAAGAHDAHAILLRFQQAEARNMSAAQSSWWMQNVAPYLNSGKAAASLVGSIASPVAIGRGAKALSRYAPSALPKNAPILR